MADLAALRRLAERVAKATGLAAALLLSACDDDSVKASRDQFERFGVESERNGFLCARAHPDWDAEQCFDLYKKVLKSP
jgi:hypothetical protein